MDFETISQFFTTLFGEYWGVVSLSIIVSVCAILAAFMKAPDEKSGIIYKCLYKVINWFAANVGKAKNADDAKKLEQKEADKAGAASAPDKVEPAKPTEK